MRVLRLPLLLALLLLGLAPAEASDAGRQAILEGLRVAATQADPAFTGFSGDRGETLFLTEWGLGKPDTPTCTTCHGTDPTTAGRTRAGKSIEPIALSATPTRFSDPDEVDKWFGRNCRSVLGRECTPLEKGDFITFMSGR
jgi:hypothetical protein